MKNHAMLTRRGMIGAAAGAVLAPALTGIAAATGSTAGGPQCGGFKIGVCDWMTGKGGSPESLDWAAALGIDGVQLSFGAPGDKYDLRVSENRDLYVATAKKTGVQLASLGMGILNKVPYKSEAQTQQWLSDAVDAAQQLGLRVILIAFFNNGDLKNDAAGTAETIRKLKEIAPKAEKAGVYLGVESWLSADEHLKILDAVASSHVGVYYDVGNSLKMGYDIYKEIRQLGKRIVEFHAKDYAAKGFGLGDIDFWKVRAAMDDIGYRGWFHLEGPMPYGREKTYRHDRDYLKTVFPPNV